MLIVDIILGGLILGGMYALVAMGLTLQYGVARIMNLAYGEVLIAAAFASYLLFTTFALSPLVGMVLVLPAGFAASWLIYRVLLVPLVLRSALREVEKTDERLHSPGAQTLNYIVPEGQDPTILVTALHHAGYEVVADPAGGEQRLLIGCPGGREADRAAIRAVIEHVQTTGIDGVGLRVDHARFEDEV